MWQKLSGSSGKKRKADAYAADIRRAVSHGKKRFFAMLLITLLGVMMFSGLKAACVDLRLSADHFFDAQNLHDVYIQSTLGLTDADLAVLRSVSGVLSAEGEYAETVKAVMGREAGEDERHDLQIRIILPGGTDLPYVISGRLPETAAEIAVTEKCSQDIGAAVGDRIRIPEPDEDTHILQKEFTVTGIVVDVTDVNNPFGSVSYRSSTTDPDTAFVLSAAVDADYYTAVALILSDTAEQNTFYEGYRGKVKRVTAILEDEIRKQREEARTEEIKSDAREEWQEERDKADREFEDAEMELHDGEKEFSQKIAEGEEELEAGRRKLDEKIREAERELAEGREEMDRELAKGLKKLLDGEKEWKEGKEKLDRGETELEANEKKAEKEFLKARKKIEKNEKKLAAAKKKIDASEKEIADGEAKIAEEEPKVTAGLAAVESGLKEIEPNLSQVEAQINEVSGQAAALEGAIAEAEQAAAAYAAQMEAQAGSGGGNADEGSAGGADSGSGDEGGADSGSGDEGGEDSGSGGEGAGAGVDSGGGDLPQIDIEALRGQLAAAKAGLSELTAAKEELVKTQSELQAKKETLEAAKKEIEKNKKKLAGGRKELESGKAEYEKGVKELDEGKAKLDSEEASAKKKIADGRKEIEEGRAKLESSRKQLDEGWEEYEKGKAEGEKKLADGEKELEDGKKEGEEEIADGKKELLEGIRDGEKELKEGWETYGSERADAEKKLRDAWKEIEDLDAASWYIQDRSSLSGFSNIRSDADSIEAIATVFPIVFFIVAILMSLTTITRMVEEDRGLIGTYKSLGFTDREIRRKYLIYAALACAAGSLAGTVMAYIVLPKYLFTIFSVMYLLPDYVLSFVPSYGLTGPFLFLAGILGAAAFACKKELAETPASLMRPKAPADGSRVFLERIAPIWKRMTFLSKVTARNLFRYKKRMFMTVFGIAGCMALLLFGFAIGDSVHDLSPRQYVEITKYDLLAVAKDGDEGAVMMEGAKEMEEIEAYQPILFSTAKIIFGGEEENVQLLVFPEGVTDIRSYLSLRDTEGRDLQLRDGEMYVTRNAGNVHHFGAGDAVTIQLPDLQRADLTVSALADYYLGNAVFMTEGTYRMHFEKYEENGLLAHLSDTCSDEAAFSEAFGKREEVVTAISTAELRDQFAGAFRLIDVVVYIVIVISAALAFVVLFTLQTTNISERQREIATIKVLGFYDREVHLYIDKETLILTAIGIVIGIPIGYAFAQTLTVILNLPSIYLAVSLHPASYIISAGLTFGFAVLVSCIMDRSLDHVDPAEALKSVE